MRFLLLLLSCLFLINASAEPAVNAVTTTYKFSSPENARRFSDLTSETRCVVCQFQNIADSNAPLAGSIREKIYHLIQDNKSDAEIKDYLVKRYGEVILLKPRFNNMTLLLWLFPFIACLAGILIIAKTMRMASH